MADEGKEVDPELEAEVDPELETPYGVSPLETLFGAAQCFAFAIVIFYLAGSMDSYLSNSPMPDGYTARNISVTVRTIFRGLIYLAAFIFGANGTGLLALTVKLAIFGDDAPTVKAKQEPELPKVGLTSDLDDISRAFDAAQDLERARKRRARQQEGSS